MGKRHLIILRTGRVSVLLLGIIFSALGFPQTAQATAPVPNEPEPAPPVETGLPSAGQPRPLFAATPSLSLNIPPSVMLGSQFTFSATFDNTGADPGYGPFIDIVLPAAGADGMTSGVLTPPSDGVSFVSASYLGAAIPADQVIVQTFPDDDGAGPGTTGCVQHPIAVRPANDPPLPSDTSVPRYYQICGGAGDELVTIILPFGSFVTTQPPASVTITAQMSNLADLGTALTIRGQSGFQFGETPINDFCCAPYDATIPVSLGGIYDSSTWPGSPVEPEIITISKDYVGPENETATGPNYPRQFEITVDIADGQTVGVAGDPTENLVITDTLPNNIQYISLNSSTPAGASCSEPSTSTPGGTLTCSFDSVTGGAGAADATLTFSFYVDRINSGGGDVIDPFTGAPANSDNTVNANGTWDPIDTRDEGPPLPTATANCGVPCVGIQDQSIVVQKGVTNITDASNSPGDVLEYTLNFQISDFFGFEAIDLTDTFSDAQRFDDTFVPTIQINGNGGNDLATVAMDMNNVDIACRFSSGSYPAYCDSTPAVDAGQTTIVFNLSDELVTQSFNGQLLGGCVDPTAENNPPDCGSYNNGGTTGTITFRTVIQDQFTDGHLPSPPNSGDPSVDHGDILNNDVDIEGNVLNISVAPIGGVFTTTTGGTPTDDSSASVTIEFGGLDKSIFAVNGNMTLPEYISPGDVVTYRLTYTQPTSDFEDTTLTDYLPLPVFSATELGSGNMPEDTCTNLHGQNYPPPGSICLHANDTYHSLVDPNPKPSPMATFTTDAAGNSLTIVYGEYDSINNTSSVIDILFSVTVESDPFADGLFLTNQATSSEGTTNAGDQTLTDIVQIKIGEPVLSIGKTAVSSDHQPDTDIIFTPPQALMSQFSVPGGVGAPFSGTITSQDLSTDPSDENAAFDLFNATMEGVDGSDLVKYAIVIENRGHSANGAYDLAISDILPPGMIIPGGSPGLNLQVYNGTGSAFGFEVIDFGGDGEYGTGDDSVLPGTPANAPLIFDANHAIRVIDPAGPSAPGSCQVHSLTGGANVIIVTYDLMLPNGEPPATSIINTASLYGYGSVEGGENFLEEPINDDAEIITKLEPGFTKVLTSTDVDNINNGATDVVIGEVLTYTITTQFYELTYPNTRIVDTLDAGLAFVDVISVTNSNSTDLTSTVMTFDGTGACTNCVAGTTVGTSNPLIENNGGTVTFDFGDIANVNSDDLVQETITIVYRAVATNVVTSQASSTLSNSANLTWTTGSLTDDDNDVTVIEPYIATAKVANPTSVDAGNTVTYTVTLTNGNNVTDTDAFDVTWSDTLPVGTTYVGGTLALGTCPNAPDTLSDAAAPTLTANWDGANAFPKNSSCEITFDATIDYSVTPGETLTNTADTAWTSLPGDVTNVSTYNTDSDERTGDDLGGTVPQNDYTSTGDADVTITNPVTVKYLITTSETHTSDDPILDGSPGNERPVAIGEIIRYRLVTTIPEGTSPNFQVNDRLPNGLIFLNDNTAKISFVSNGGITSSPTGTLPVPAIAGCNATGTTADATTPVTLLCTLADENIASTMSTSTNTDTYGSGTDIFFKLGDLVNNDSDADAEYVVIELNAIVHNSETHRNDAGEDKGNFVRNFINGAPNGNDSADVEVNVVEPHLVIDKNIVTPANDAGDPMVYRISITNDADTFFGANNAAPAFDLVLSDSLDSNLNLQSITIYTAGEYGSLFGLTSCGGTVQTVTDMSTTGIGGTASVDISCLNAGETLVVDVNTVVINTASAGVTIPNAATITGTSLPGGDAGIYDSDGNSTGSDIPGNPGDDDGERDGSDTDTGGKDDYYDIDNADQTLDMPAPVKSITATSEAHTDDTTGDTSGDPRPLVIGEIMRYRLAVQLPEGTNTDFIVEDIIPAGLTFIDGTLELQYWADNNVTNTDATANTDLNGANSGAISLPVAYFSLVGQTLAIDLESPINNDINDGNTEYVILEFNVLVNNDATNQNTTIHDNDFTVEVNGNTPVASNTVYSEVLEPKLYIDKSTADSNWLYGETVTYALEVGHVSSANDALDSTTDAYDIVITDDIPTELTYGTVDLTGAPGWTASYADPTLTLSCLASNGCSLPLDNTVTIAFTATVNTPPTLPPPAPDTEYLDGAETATNTADMVWTSLPGTGTTGNPTGSNTPGASGDSDGERNGTSGGENDYNDSDSQDGQLNYYALGNRVWFDTDNSATINGSEVGVAGVSVLLYDAATMTEINVGPDGIPGTADDAPGGVATDANGYYLFDYLAAGDYVVVIPAAELGSGGTLEGYYSSQTAMNGSGVITETAAPDPDNDTDSDDNGTLDTSGGALNGAVVSLPVTLGPIAETEPTDDDDFANGTSEDSDQIDGRSNLSVDFGFYKTAIGNLVWLDENPDGAYVPADDTLLNGVTVQLYNGVTDALIASATTANITTDGEYLFDNLPEGEYVIRVVAPAQTVSTRDDADQADNDAPNTNTDNNDNGDGTSAGIVASAALTMDAGNSGAQTNNTVDDSTGTTTNPTMDFGFSYAYALGNRVWFDTNNNSLIDDDGPGGNPDEVGVNDVTVELYAADGSGNPTGAVLATDVTTSDGTNDGYYLFDYLFPGDYVVVIPAGEFDSTSPLGGTLESYWSSATTLSSGGVLGETAAPDPDNDTDSDDNGTLDTSGGAFDGAVVSAAVTLGPGAGSEPGGETDLEGGFDGDQPDTRANMTVDFGFYRTEIGNLVYGDVNKNGNYESGTDTLFNGVTVQLYNSDGTVEIGVGADGIWGTADDAAGGIQTDANGEYRFSGLPEGEYVVTVIAPSGTVSTIDTFDAADMANPNTNTDNNDNGQGENDGVVEANTLTMNPGVDGAKPNRTVTQSTGTTLDYTVDFGFTTIYALGNRVWYDTNNDSLIDNGEVGVDNVAVDLYAADGSGNPTGPILASDTTTNGGYYLFDYLEDGDYVVVIPDTNFGGGAVLEGYWSSATTRNADGSLSEIVAPDPDNDLDSDDNGTMQTVGAFSGSVISSAVTLGPTAVEPTLEADLEAGIGQGDQPDTQANMTVDFGFYTMTLGNLVWNDVNTQNNGLFESGTEAGIDGVEIQLWTADLSTQLDSVTTAGGGIYTFTGLPQGDYILRIPAAEFEGAQTLRDYVTSTGALPLSYYEPAPDADVDLTDSDDNGTETGGTTGLGGYVQSAAVTMTPTGEASYDNNTGTTVEPRVDFGVFNSPQADLAITKDDGTSYYLQGGTLTYTIVVSNNGPADVTGAVVEDAIPTAQIASWDWACTSSTGGASGCDPVAGSTTDFNDTINLPA